jgi:RNA polymerase sigma factor (sigma-70 family)
MTATRSLSASIQHLGRALLAADAGCPDAELVRRFAERRDEGAFAALVQRHGAVVLAVCRRVLRHEQDAEDAFQAAFLVLARSAGSLRKAAAVGSWLYGVAYNVARKARATRLRREAKEREAAARQQAAPQPAAPADWQEVLDAELHALPEKYRTAVVLCDLMGRTTAAAAAEVGCPPKTLGTRLSRGRSLLAGRLARRGVAVPGGVLALALALPRGAAAAALPPLIPPAVHAALGLASGSAAVSPAVAALTQGVSNLMLLKSPKCVVLLAGAALVVAGITRHAGSPAQTDLAQSTPAAAAAPARRAEVKPAGFFDHVHRMLFAHVHALLGLASPRAAAAEDKKAELSGSWVRKEGELKIEFADKGVMKVYPHGDNEVIVLTCEYTVEKGGLVKAKITALDGKETATEKAKELVPVGLKFSFKWKAKDDAATVADLKGDKTEHLKSHLEGDYTRKK